MVHADPTGVRTPREQDDFAQSVAKWTESKVASHKFLRGGVQHLITPILILIIVRSRHRCDIRNPEKVSTPSSLLLTRLTRHNSAAGKILRRELRERAKREFTAGGVQAKL